MTSRLVVLGAGGNGAIVAAAALSAAGAGAGYVLEGFLDDGEERGRSVLGLPVLGRLADWSELPADTVFIPAIQKIGDMRARSVRVRGLGIPRERWASVCRRTRPFRQRTADVMFLLTWRGGASSTW